MMYGDYALRVSRVLFVNGDIDPWHALSFTTNTTQHPAILIHGMLCADGKITKGEGNGSSS